ncbi:MAG TPA: sugar ABC transporter substrate-binding protein [Limnochordia bacterium]|nr:sugar ABC transporter substrate-binding protein [Limnochordia bacterium]
MNAKRRTKRHLHRLAAPKPLWAALALGVLIAAPASAATTIEVFIRPNTSDEPIYAAIKQAFEASHPDIRIDYVRASFSDYWKKIPVLYAADTAPDVIFPSTSYAVQYALQGMLLPLDELAAQDHFDLNQYFAPIIDQYRVGGTLYALPNDFAALAYIYNVDQFNEAGLTQPQNGWSWAQFLAAATKLTQADANGKVTRFATTWPYTTPFIWSASGSNFFDDELWPSKFLLDSPAGFEGAQFLQDLRWRYHVAPRPGEKADFVHGTAAMQTLGHWTIPSMLQQASFKWNLVSLPVDRYAVQRKDGSGWSIMKNSKHIKEAWAFVKFIAGPEGEKLQAGLQFITPAQKAAAASSDWRDIPGHPDVSQDAFVAGLEHAFNNYILTNPRADAFNKLINPALNKVFNNQATPKGAIAAIAPAVNELLAQVQADKAKRQGN